ncbi:ankyrin repeat domain-containing protein [Singulisphaera sp. Ch08]|uniref:ankyrin repeat domain-containing protein n=1 Tax=Singulisphaera sp. Ch08 TaxID=3120278 RepID=UPI0038736299
MAPRVCTSFNIQKDQVHLLRTVSTAVSISDRHGNQPLWTAALNARGNYEMVSMLLRYGANPNHLNNANLSPFDIAKRKNDSTMLQLLEERVS